MSKRSKSKNLKSTTALTKLVVKPVQAVATTSKSKAAAIVAIPNITILPEKKPPAVKSSGKNGSRPTIATPVDPNNTQLTVPHVAASIAETKRVDPIAAVAASPGKLVTASHVTSTPETSILKEVLASSPNNDLAPSGTTPWDYSSKLFDIGQANTLCITNFAQRYATARTPQDVMTITKDFYEEQGRLFKQHSEAMLKMMSLHTS